MHRNDDRVYMHRNDDTVYICTGMMIEDSICAGMIQCNICTGMMIESVVSM